MKKCKKLLALALALTLALGALTTPAAAANSCDGVVIASSLSLRSGAGTGYAVLATAPRGAALTVIGVSTENGSWFKVNYNGTVGYMDASYVMSAGSSEAAAAIAEAANAASGAETPAVETPAATETPAEQTPIEVGAPAATETPAATTDPEDPTWLILTPSGASNAVVTGELVRFRSSPGGAIVGNFQNGTRILVNASSGAWYEVDCNGTIGYVHSSYVTLESVAPPADSSNTTPAETVTQPAATPAPVVSTPTPVNSGAGQSIVNTAMQYQGVPYVWGGSSPSGFDCSGLCYYVFQQCGYSINRVADSIYSGSGVSVSYDQLAPGDIICFGNSSYVWHVGIYVGNGQFIHAPYTGAVVRVESLSGTYKTNFVCGKRIV